MNDPQCQIRDCENRINHLQRLAHDLHGQDKVDVYDKIEELKKQEETANYRLHQQEYVSGFWSDLRQTVGGFFRGFTGLWGRPRHH